MKESPSMSTSLEDAKQKPPIPRPFLVAVNWKEFLCGWGAGFTNICILFPLNKLLYRQMMYGVNMMKAARKLQQEGVFTLYRGILPPLCQKTFTHSLMFGVYNQVREPLIENNVNEYLAKTAAGISAAFAESILLPFQRVQALLCDFKYNYHFKNMLHAIAEIKCKYGPFEFYRGYVPFLLRTCPTNVLFFIGKEEVKKNLPEIRSPILNSITEFAYGATLGCALSCMFYPITVAKLTMQRSLGTQFESTFTVLRRIYHERGGKVRYIFYGVPTNIIRSFMSWGILNVGYETIKKLIC